MTAESLIDLADTIGFEAIDQEVAVWIEYGGFDIEVAERAKHIGTEPEPLIEHLNARLQYIHRYIHPDGPWGWEYCGRCVSRTRKVK